MRQLPLGMRLHDRAVFASFYDGDNALPLRAVRELAATPGEGLLYLHGVAGTGKSHLLQAFCAAVPGAGYFPLAQLRELGAGVLEGAEQMAALAIDDLDAIASAPEWERQLFQLYNELVTRRVPLLVAARVPAVELSVALPDLVSRLAAMAHYALRPLDEPQQGEALRLRASLRGLELPDETLQYLQRRFVRDMSQLTALLDRLDEASLRAQRRLTVPFIREVLGRALT